MLRLKNVIYLTKLSSKSLPNNGLHCPPVSLIVIEDSQCAKEDTWTAQQCSIFPCRC